MKRSVPANRGLAGGYSVAATIVEQNKEELDMLHTVAVGDVDGSGKPDIVVGNIWIPGETAGKTFRVRWYRNGDWRPRDIYVGELESARLLLHDVSGTGRPDVMRASRYGNTLSWLEAPKDPTEGEWREHIIDRFPIVHDIAVGDIDGDGRGEVVAGAVNDQGGCLYWYRIPEDPRGPWRRNVIDGEINRTQAGDHWGGHGLDLFDIDGDGRLDALTTSMGQGRFLWYRNPGPPFTGIWEKRWIGGSQEEGTSCLIRAVRGPSVGAPMVFAGGEHPMGSGENLTPENRKFMLFTPAGDAHAEPWNREILDAPGEVHDIRIVDIDRDGTPEVLVANRIQNRLLCYDYWEGRWNRLVLDDTIQASDIAVADFDADGELEIAAVGLRTADVKIYKITLHEGKPRT